jgi:hypothetical protein
MKSKSIEDCAFAAHRRACEREGAIHGQSSTHRSGEETCDGKRFMVLRNTNGILRVYHILDNDHVREAKKWSEALEFKNP